MYLRPSCPGGRRSHVEPSRTQSRGRGSQALHGAPDALQRYSGWLARWRLLSTRLASPQREDAARALSSHDEVMDWITVGVSACSLVVSVSAYIRTGRWRAAERREATPRFEIITKPWFGIGNEGEIAFQHVEIIAENMSTSEVTITELGLQVASTAGPVRIFSSRPYSFPQTIGGGKALYHTIPARDFTEFLDNVPDRPDDPEFIVFVRSGHGSLAKQWDSEPFSIVSSVQPPTAGYSAWVERNRRWRQSNSGQRRPDAGSLDQD